jgi:hypothetical protein
MQYKTKEINIALDIPTVDISAFMDYVLKRLPELDEPDWEVCSINLPAYYTKENCKAIVVYREKEDDASYLKW